MLSAWLALELYGQAEPASCKGSAKGLGASLLNLFYIYICCLSAPQPRMECPEHPKWLICWKAPRSVCSHQVGCTKGRRSRSCLTVWQNNENEALRARKKNLKSSDFKMWQKGSSFVCSVWLRNFQALLTVHHWGPVLVLSCLRFSVLMDKYSCMWCTTVSVISSQSGKLIVPPWRRSECQVPSAFPRLPTSLLSIFSQGSWALIQISPCLCIHHWWTAIAQ